MKNFKYSLSSSYNRFRSMPALAITAVALVAFFLIPLILGILFVFAAVAILYVVVKSLLSPKRNIVVKQRQAKYTPPQTIEIEGEVLEER